MIKIGIFNHFGIDDGYFDYDYNYEYKEYDKVKYMRGGREYLRPYGWYRFGLKIRGKYDNGDDKWLGDNNSEGEWVNAYHGTKIRNVNSILKVGLRPGTRNQYGIGIYCSPKIKTATEYADSFEYEGNYYQVVIQVRVKPDKIVECKSKGGNEDYWYIEKSENIRNFGLLMKTVEKKFTTTSTTKPKPKPSLQQLLLQPLAQQQHAETKPSYTTKPTTLSSTTKQTLTTTTTSKVPQPSTICRKIVLPAISQRKLSNVYSSSQLHHQKQNYKQPLPKLPQQSQSSTPLPPLHPQQQSKASQPPLPPPLKPQQNIPPPPPPQLSQSSPPLPPPQQQLQSKLKLSQPLPPQQQLQPKLSQSFQSYPPPPLPVQPSQPLSPYSKTKKVDKYVSCCCLNMPKTPTYYIDCIISSLTFIVLVVFIVFLSMKFVNYLDYKSSLLQKYAIIAMFSCLSISLEIIEVFINCFKLKSLNYVGYRLYSTFISIYYVLISVYTAISDLSLPFHCFIIIAIFHLFGSCCMKVERDNDDDAVFTTKVEYM